MRVHTTIVIVTCASTVYSVHITIAKLFQAGSKYEWFDITNDTIIQQLDMVFRVLKLTTLN